MKLFTTKKNIYFLIGGVILVALLVSFFLLRGKEPAVYTFAQLCRLTAGEVERLTIIESAGGEHLVVEDKETIVDFLEILSTPAFQEMGDRGSRSEWTHKVELYRDAESYLRLIFNGEEVELASYEQGYKEWEALYTMDTDLTFQLKEYHERLLEAKEKAREEELGELVPARLTVKEIEPAICVVINNYPSARPSSGLQEADIIYEFLVEGGTTRYLAVFKTKHLENFDIGPIRSLRPYFAVQSLEYGGIIAHSGYSVRTMEMISGLGIFQIGDVGNNFWRDRSRRAPHNLYTSIDNLYRVALNRIDVVERVYELDKEVKVGYQLGQTVNINYSGHNRVSYLYDDNKGVYYRYINDNPHSDRETGEQYYADRIIIRETSHRNVPGPEALVDIDLQGVGEGLLYEKGRKYYITWENPGRETTYYYTPDIPVESIPGTTWIQVVRR